MKRLLIYLTVIIFFTPFNLTAQIEPDVEKLKTFFEALYKHEKFMGSAVILHGDELVFNQAYGFTNEEHHPAEPESIYHIGSITKTMTAAIILKLKEEEKISLTNTLSDYYPDLPNAENITIEHLLRHRSGLVNFTNMPEYAGYYTDEISKEDLLNLFRKYGVEFEPDERFEYSNTGYVLLGYIIEDVTGLTFGEVIEKYIAVPAGLSRTFYVAENSGRHILADSFAKVDGWQMLPKTNMAIPHAAGGVALTAEETARFFKALFEGEIISSEFIELMTAHSDGMGMGIFMIPFYDKYAFGHTGGIDGFHTVAAYFPEEDLSFAIFSNGLNYVMNDITIGLLSLTFGREFDIPDFETEETEIIHLTIEEMARYTGNYVSDQLPLDIRFFEQEGRLMSQATGQGAFPLTAVSETTMKFDPAGIVIEFSDYKNDRYHAFRLKQAGQEFQFQLEE